MQVGRLCCGLVCIMQETTADTFKSVTESYKQRFFLSNMDRPELLVIRIKEILTETKQEIKSYFYF